jgi:hypothetical protein
MSHYLGILFSLVLMACGVILIIGAYNRWPVLVDPPKEMSIVYSQQFIRRLFGKRAVLWDTYCVGILFVASGAFGLWCGLR